MKPFCSCPIPGAALLLSSLLALGLVSGCGGGRRPYEPGGGPGGSGEPAAADLTAVGWLAFEEGDFEGAEANFRAALEAVDGYPEALNGTGWALLKSGSLAEANGAFEEAIAGSLETAEPHAGRAVALRDIEPVDYAACIYAARDALAFEPRWTFAHDETLDWRDLRLIIGQAAWELGAYDTANDQVDSLGGEVQADTSATFVEDLLQELERLGGESAR